MRDFKNVLVPVDFSPCSDAAVEEAVDIARPYGAAVHLLYVWKPSPFTLGPDAPPTSLKSFALSSAGEKMKAYLRQLEAVGVEARGRVEHGDPEDAIVSIAEREDYDLIVMGTHGRGGVAHFLRGSVAEHVVRRASCPVLTVHDHGARRQVREGGRAEAGSTL